MQRFLITTEEITSELFEGARALVCVCECVCLYSKCVSTCAEVCENAFDSRIT